MGVDVICDARAFHCHCALPPGHDGPHLCGNDGGSWTGDPLTPEFTIVCWPGGVTGEALLDALLGGGQP